MAESWTVARGAEGCSQCGREFREGQALFSALREEPEGFVRQDFCLPCWKEAPDRAFFSFWRTRRTGEERPRRIDTEVIFDFFIRVQASDRPDRTEMLFVLALYLARRKALKFESVAREDGREVLLFRRPRRDETFRLENPRLNEEQIAAATEHLKELFQTEV